MQRAAEHATRSGVELTIEHVLRAVQDNHLSVVNRQCSRCLDTEQPATDDRDAMRRPRRRDQLPTVVDGSEEERTRNQGVVVATKPFNGRDIRLTAGCEHQHVVRHVAASRRTNQPTRTIDADNSIAEPDVDPVPLVPPGGAQSDVVENMLASQYF